MKKCLIVTAIAMFLFVFFWLIIPVFAGGITIVIHPDPGEISAEYMKFAEKFSQALIKQGKKAPLVENYQILIAERWNEASGERKEKLIGIILKRTDKVPLWFIKTEDLKKYPEEIEAAAEEAAEITHRLLKDFEKTFKKTKKQKISI
ncbi:hypothetical protein KJ853_00100 [Patescibacteria group bacterium]|nr:hypothetical protein [Patescibacteria group bacterium]